MKPMMKKTQSLGERQAVAPVASSLPPSAVECHSGATCAVPGMKGALEIARLRHS